MENYTQMPQLDSVPAELSQKVSELRRRVQLQGDPLLTLKLDDIAFISDPKKKIEALTNIIQGVKWKEGR